MARPVSVRRGSARSGRTKLGSALVAPPQPPPPKRVKKELGNILGPFGVFKWAPAEFNQSSIGIQSEFNGPCRIQSELKLSSMRPCRVQSEFNLSSMGPCRVQVEFNGPLQSSIGARLEFDLNSMGPCRTQLEFHRAPAEFNLPSAHHAYIHTSIVNISNIS